MSNSRKYYYVVSSLPELKFGGKLPFTIKEFLNEYEGDLAPDKQYINLIIAKNDIKNIKLLFKNNLKEENKHQPSVYSIEELKEGVKVREGIYDFIIDFLGRHETNEQYLDNFTDLEKDYFIYGSKSENDFLRDYFQFELDFRNVVSALRARGKDINILKYTSGSSDEIVLSKVKNNKSLPDFGLAGEAPWMDKVIQAFDKEDPLLLEETLDRIRFEQIDNMTLLLSFELDKILAFIIKLSIIERWNSFNKDKGREYTRNIVRGVKE